MLKHDATVTDTIKGADSDVRAICEQAKTGKERRDIARRGVAVWDAPPDSSRDDAAEDWAKPNDDRRIWVRGNVSTGDRQWMQHNTLNGATSGQCADNVA